MTQGEYLAGVAEEHFFVGDMAADAYGVHAHSRDIGTARTLKSSVSGIR